MSRKGVYYGIGFGIGAIMVGMIFMNNVRSKEGRKEEERLLGYVVEERLLPGEDLGAKMPYYAKESVVYRETVKDEMNQFYRVQVVYNGKEGYYVRVMERVWRHPEYGYERLVKRQLMYGDRFLVRMKEGGEGKLGVELERLGMRWSKLGRGKGLYEVKLEENKVTSYEEIMEVCKGIDGVEAVMPYYLMDRSLMLGYNFKG